MVIICKCLETATVMKDAFKVTESGEVFSDTKITNMSDVLHQALIKNLTQCTVALQMDSF